MFLDSKAFVCCFLFIPHDMEWLVARFLPGLRERNAPDEVMQSGEMCRFGFCDIRWEDESIAVRVEGAGQKHCFCAMEGD